jgi:hypothetical protein
MRPDINPGRSGPRGCLDAGKGVNPMIHRHNHDLSYLEFPHLSEYADIRHGIFTRLGGFSKGCYQGLNIGMGNGDSLNHVLQNRAAISDCMGHCELVFANQVHGTTIINNAEKRTCNERIIINYKTENIFNKHINEMKNFNLINLFKIYKNIDEFEADFID